MYCIIEHRLLRERLGGQGVSGAPIGYQISLVGGPAQSFVYRATL